MSARCTSLICCNKTKKTTSDSLMKGRQSNAKITKPNITKNIKSSHMSLDQNKPKERTEDVICVDDDESNDDIVEVQPVQKNVFKPLNNFNNTIKINRPVIPTTNVLNISNALNFQRKIVPITDGSSKYSKTEEMTVTPDMPIPDIDIPNPVEAVYFNDYDPTPVVKPTVRTPLVTPETGFHFLFASEQTVDLTQSDNQQKKKRGPTKGKRKNKSHENQIMPPKKICKQSLIVPTSPDITSIMTQASTSKTPQKEQKTRKESIIVPVISEKTIESMQPSTSKTLTTKELKTRKKSIIVPVISEKTIESMQPSTSKTQLKTTKELKTRKKSIIVPVISEKTIKSMQPSTSKTQLKTTKELPVKTMPKPRPKRASAVASANSDSKNHLARKLGKHLHGEWKLEVVKLDISLYTCPICKKLFYKPESRRKHEKKHILPTKFTKKSSVQTVSALENTISTEQEEFLGYFNLVKQISLNVTQMDRLATRKKLLKSLKCVGDVIGSYSCHHCEYKTCRLFILWAHMSSCHIQLYSEKKCGAFCFVCNRYLGKRSKLLKHLDNCTVNRDEDETKTTEKLSCDYCDEDIISMAHLEKHLWNHAAS